MCKSALQTAHDLIHIVLSYGSCGKKVASVFPVLSNDGHLSQTSPRPVLSYLYPENRQPGVVLACVWLSEPAPHHSAKKHIVAVHSGLLLLSVWLRQSHSSISLEQHLPFSNAIQLPTSAHLNQLCTRTCLKAASKYRQSLAHRDPTPSQISLNPVGHSIEVAIDS